MSLVSMQDAKEQIRAAVDIVDLAGEYVALQQKGRGYVALCPWHDDSRPSLQINPARQSFKCWVCDIGGDIFTLVMKIEGVEFREALELLAERAGITLTRSAQGTGGDNPLDRRQLLRVMAWAEQQYHQCLLKAPAAEAARSYLVDRGINEQSVERFQLGFAPPEWDWLLRRASQAGVLPAALERVGLAAPRDRGGHYDRFRGRLMFSIRDLRGRPIACGGRSLPEFAREGDAKYINSPETPLFNKSRELYALDVARQAVQKAGQIVVMEGYTDVIMAHQHGVENCVAVLGTALNEQHIPLIKRFTDSITLVLDGDDAGQGRTMDIVDKLLALFVAQDVELRILGLPDGCDPCDVIRSQGREAFVQLFEQSRDALTHKMEVVMSSLGTTPSAHRTSHAVEEILATLARALPRGQQASSVALVREQQTLSRLSRRFGIADDTLRTRLRALRQSLPTLPAHAAANRVATATQEETSFEEPTGWQRELIELLLANPDAIAELAPEIRAEEISFPVARKLYELALSMHERGESPTFDRLMLAVDAPQVKRFLVDCDEVNAARVESDPAQRLVDALAGARRRRQEMQGQNQLAALHQKQMNPQQEEEVLAELFKNLKQQQDSIQR